MKFHIIKVIIVDEMNVPVLSYYPENDIVKDLKQYKKDLKTVNPGMKIALCYNEIPELS